METAWDIFQRLNTAVGLFHSTENPMKKVSNRELKQWFNDGVIQFNNHRVNKDTTVDPKTLEVVVLFPKNDKKRKTIGIICTK